MMKRYKTERAGIQIAVACAALALLSGLVISTSVSASSVPGALNWTEQSPATSPPATNNPSMAYDAALGEVVLFGGSSGNQTWTYNGTTWTQQHPATSPPAVDLAQMAY